MKKILGFLISKRVDILITVIVLLMLSYPVLIINNRNKAKTITSLKQTVASQTLHNHLWRNNFNELVLTSAVSFKSLKELKKSSDSTIKKLVNNNSRLNNKLKNTEYLLDIALGMKVDTNVVVQKVYINDTLYKEIDSLQIASFTLVRLKYSNELTAKYEITYKPELFISINHYKDGKWRLRNLFVKRDVIYKVDVKANDDILQPASLTVVKVNK